MLKDSGDSGHPLSSPYLKVPGNPWMLIFHVFIRISLLIRGIATANRESQVDHRVREIHCSQDRGADFSIMKAGRRQNAPSHQKNTSELPRMGC